MSQFAALALRPSDPSAASRGVSAASIGVEESYAQAFQRLCEPIASQEAIGRTQRIFFNLFSRHAIANWDGDGAEPVTSEVVARAYEFVMSLPPKFANPDVSVNGYGDVELEWYVRPDRLLTLAISHGGQYHFASRNGFDRRSGAGYLGGVPPSLLLAIVPILTE